MKSCLINKYDLIILNVLNLYTLNWQKIFYTKWIKLRSQNTYELDISKYKIVSSKDISKILRRYMIRDSHSCLLKKPTALESNFQ